MNITDLMNEHFEKAEIEFGKDDSTVKLSKDMFRIGSYVTLKEIYRLNFPAFTFIYDDELSKQGFVNMLLNHLIDKEDDAYGKLHFDEKHAWKDIDCEPPENDKRFLIIKRTDDKLDFAKFTKERKWFDQNDSEVPIEKIKEWRYMDNEIF